ncbi:MAG: hypothetical protein QM488_12195 [Rhizobiaceae bacterium]
MGRTSKIHAAVDTKERPFQLAVSGGQLYDSQMMDAFLDWEMPPLAIVADKAYGVSKSDNRLLMKAHWLSFQPRATQSIQLTMIEISTPNAILSRGSSPR